MTLEEYCKGLPRENKLSLSVYFLKTVLPLWNKFAEKGRLSYRDSVVWEKHTVDREIISRVIIKAENPSDNIKSILEEFSDPVTALQDDDWKLPPSAEKIFYSAYNLINALADDNDSEQYFYLSINQAIDVIDKEKLLGVEELKSILAEYKS